MPVYIDKKTKKYYVEIYTTINAKAIRKKKRGFEKKKDAQIWEREFLTNITYNPKMNAETLFNKYIEEKRIRWKEKTYLHRKYIINGVLIPYFKNKTIENITAKDILKFQNYLLENGYSLAYIYAIEKLLSSIYTFICTYHNIKENVMKKIKKIGKNTKQNNERVWNEEKFDTLITYLKNTKHKSVNTDGLIAVFSTLFYTGMRSGELFALTWKDIDFENKTVNITKTLFRRSGKDIITPPKTENSIRIITIPDNLVMILKKYKETVYSPTESSRVFSWISPSTLSHTFRNWSKKANLPEIRLHDLRHSHATVLLSKGAPIGAISKRLGHSNISVTLNTYSHVLKEDNDKLMDILNK